MSIFQAIGAGLATGAAGFLIGGPIGGLAGFGIGMFGAASGMRGDSKTATGTGALIGGLAGFALGGPVGALAGGVLGGLGGKFISGLFKPKHQPPTNSYQYPQMIYGGGGMGYGMGMPSMGYGIGMSMGMGYGMGMPGMGMSMGMSMGMPGMGMSMGMSIGMPGMQGMNQGGQLQQQGGNGKPITYTTSGGYKVQINGDVVSITDPTGKNTVKHWGDPHENVNGKNIKDWEGKDRTLVLGDGTKITMNADSPQGVVKHTSIYDGAQGIQINNQNNTIENVSFNPWQTQMMEARQADGETSYMGFGRNGDFVYKNLYTQDRNLNVTPNYKELARSSETGLWNGAANNMFGQFGGIFWM